MAAMFLSSKLIHNNQLDLISASRFGQTNKYLRPYRRTGKGTDKGTNKYLKTATPCNSGVTIIRS